MGDLEETYHELSRAYGRTEARSWYRSQVLRSLPTVIYRTIFWNFAMFKNYLLSAVRQMRKQKGHSFVNIAGLAIGIASFLLIALYIHHEFSFDRFHADADRIYRVNLDLETSGGINELATTPALAGPTMKSTFPDVEEIVQLYRPYATTVSLGENAFRESGFLFAGDPFLDMFSFSLVQGDRETALRGPNRIVLTKSTAEKYFGGADPIGQRVTVMDSLEFEVTGVLADVPTNSHMQFDLVASLSSYEAVFDGMMQRWSPHMFHTYVRLAPGADPLALEEKFPGMVEQNVQLSGGYMFWFRLFPMTDIHFGSHRDPELGVNSRIEYVYIFGAVGLFILLIGCVNFINLSTARSTQRMREVGMRKTFGAERKTLIVQFIGEAFMYTLLAMGLALVIVWLALPAFNAIAGTRLGLEGLLSPPLALTIAGLILVVGFVAGSYPAFFLSAFRPAQVLRGSTGRSDGRKGGVLLRRALVVFQFCISAFMIAGTAVVFSQLRYMRTQNLGFEPEQILVVSGFNAADGAAADRYEEQARSLASVQHIAQSNAVPGRSTIGYSYNIPPLGADQFQVVDVLFTDPDFAETYGLELAAGRDFSEEFDADTSLAFMVNEALVRDVGWKPEDAVGQTLNLTRGSGTIVGVYSDFHYKSLHEAYEPMVFVSSPYAFGSAPLLLSMRVSTADLATTIDDLEVRWQASMPDRPFEFFFLDEDFDKQYRTEENLGGILTAFGGLAILIACLGLFALASMTAERKTKEIGIRKTLGASVGGVVGMLAADFLKLIAIAFVIAVPLSYLAAESWLNSFAYRTSPGIGLFVVTGLILAVIAILTVGYQSLRAAWANPVDALRQN